MTHLSKKTLLLVTVSSVLFLGVFLFGCQSAASSGKLIPGISSVEVVPEQQVWSWSSDIDCAPCHPAQAETALTSSCFVMHDGKIACVSCHDNVEELQNAHDGISGSKNATRLRKTSMTSDACLQCHDEDLLASDTIDSAVLVDIRGTVVNPHDLPDTGSHAEIACSECHSIHQENVIDESKEVCAGCHHAGVYQCGICHA